MSDPGPLNHGLHAALVRHYGKVLVANAGQGFRANRATDPVTGRRTYHIEQSGEYYRINCPFCQDGRHRLWVNHKFGTTDEWRGGIFADLVHCYNETSCFAQPARRQQFALVVLGPGRRGRFKALNGRATSRAEKMAAPGELTRLVDLPSDHHALWYLRDRGYNPRVLDEQYGVGYCGDLSAAHAYDRLVVPVQRDGAMVGWQARYIGDLDWKKTGIPKYYTCPGFKAHSTLYNYDHAVKHSDVVVVEGVTDVWSIGTDAVALFGKSISAAQRQLLTTVWGPRGRLILMLDGDAVASMPGLVAEFKRFFPAGVVPVELSYGEDPGKYTQDINRLRINSALDTYERLHHDPDA